MLREVELYALWLQAFKHSSIQSLDKETIVVNEYLVFIEFFLATCYLKIVNENDHFHWLNVMAIRRRQTPVHDVDNIDTLARGAHWFN